MSVLWLVFMLGVGDPEVTKCTTCHTSEGWEKVVFPHDKTGFPLLGKHASTPCAGCHVGGVERKLDRRCAGCHQDPHAGDLGQLCESCHDEKTFKGAMTAEAHRRSAFPLMGAHATIPCQECHQGTRELRFNRAAVGCVSCHLADYSRAAQTSIDHAAAAFGTDCRRCHGPQDFKAAKFPEHDACFKLSGGPHRGIACLDCHSSLTTARVTGQCQTNTAACTSCHEHECARTAEEHEGVPGYDCKDRKCYECHQVSD